MWFQRYNGFVEVEGCHQLDFLFDGYFEALARHHDMEGLDDYDADIDPISSARLSKPASIKATTEQKTKSPEQISTPSEQVFDVSEQMPLSSADVKRKKAKNKKRNQRKRAAEKIKTKVTVAADTEPADSEPEPKVDSDLATSMALVKISPSSAATPAEASKVKFIPQPKDKIWMDHDCIKSEACTQYFTLLQEAMLKVPVGDLEKRVYGPQA